MRRDEEMQPDLVDFQNFAHGFSFARREAIFLGQEVPKNPPGGISPGL